MPQETGVGMYECDCGHVVCLCEGTVREMERTSYRRPEGIGEGRNRHAVIFYRGGFMAMFCPKAGKQLLVPGAVQPKPYAPKPGQPRWTPLQGQALALIYRYTQEHGHGPSVADIAKQLGRKPWSFYKVIAALQHKGLIRTDESTGNWMHVTVRPEELPEIQR